MSPFVASVLATTVVSAIALIGIVLTYGHFWNRRNEVRVVSFAAGVLLATAFLDLFPEAFHETTIEPKKLFTAALLGMVVFFFLERLVHRFHSHDDERGHHHHAVDMDVQRLQATRVFILVGDGLHNMIDGIAIAASFIASPGLGMVTTLAVVAHEIPHELADYGILIRGGYSRRRALFLNFLSGLTAVLGAIGVFVFGGFVEEHLSYFIAATAGMFLYIASANLIPELHHQRVSGRFLYATPFLAGLAVVAGLLAVLPHEDSHADDHEASAYHLSERHT